MCKSTGPRCKEPIDRRGGHATACGVGASRTRPHNRLRDCHAKRRSELTGHAAAGLTWSSSPWSSKPGGGPLKRPPLSVRSYGGGIEDAERSGPLNNLWREISVALHSGNADMLLSSLGQ